MNQDPRRSVNANSPRTPDLGPAPNPAAGDFIGLANFAEYFEAPALFFSAFNSLHISVIPLLTPPLLSGISLLYCFGKQGVAKELLSGESFYGPIGIVIGSSYWVFPHALILGLGRGLTDT